MTTDPDELSTELRQAIEAERRVVPVVDPALLARVASSFAAVPPAPSSVPSPVAGLAAKLVPVVLALAIGAAGGWVLRGPPAPPQIVERVVRVEVPAAPPLPSAAPSAPPQAPPVPRRPTPAPLQRPVAEASAPVQVERPEDAALARERNLLDTGRSAMIQDQADAALAAVQAHEREFRNGVLAEEREALRVQALVRQGRLDEARAAFDAMAARWPGSLFLVPLKNAVRP